MDLSSIKKFNSQLEGYKKEAVRVKMERAVTENEIDRLCKELTEELGQEVTPENAEELYKEFMEKVENTISAGEEIFDRIKAEADVSGGLMQ